MPRTAVKVETFYQFDELTDDAKETAREWWRNLEAQYFWPDATIEDAITIAEILGVTITTHAVNMNRSPRQPDIYWSHSCSQGDGAMFEGSYACNPKASEMIRAHAPQDETLHRIADELTALQARHFGLLTAVILRIGHHYNHSGCMALDMQRGHDERGILPDNDDFTMEDSEHFLKDEEELTRLMRAFADWIFSQIKAEYEYAMSGENVDECITINEYEFTEEGERA